MARTKGSKGKVRLADFLSEKDVTALVEKAKELAMGGSEPMLKLLLEQKFGRAVQPVSGDEGGEPIKVAITGMRISHGT